MTHALGETLPLWSVVPFVALLLCIALLPLFAPIFWARHYPKVAIGFGLPLALVFLHVDPHELWVTAHDYVSFIILLGTLFIISGGILVRGTFPPTPWVNAAFLFCGAVLANFIGTTGASMLLIRPLLRANRARPNHAHVAIFFIFIVSNIGGALTPLGDPPLFLGFLNGVPFFWTLQLYPQWLLAIVIVLGIFAMLDTYHFRRETRHPAEPFRMQVVGAHNFLLLGGVVGAVFLPSPFREGLMAGLAAASYRLTPREIHEENEFTFHPIREVAILFFGIFMTMIPALVILSARGGQFGLREPWQFFWFTGLLSSFLDNAPTYLAFFAALQSLGLPNEVNGVPEAHLAAVSLGAVFMGANSYIGNGPNFMVKAIAEEQGVKMPSFLGYMLYSGVVLIPAFAVVTLIFFR